MQKMSARKKRLENGDKKMGININALKTGKAITIETPDVEEIVNSSFEKGLRERFQLTQSAMAAMLHVKKKTIEKWEQGKNPIKGGAAVALFLLNQDPSLIEKLLIVEEIDLQTKEKKPIPNSFAYEFIQDMAPIDVTVNQPFEPSGVSCHANCHKGASVSAAC